MAHGSGPYALLAGAFFPGNSRLEFLTSKSAAPSPSGRVARPPRMHSQSFMPPDIGRVAGMRGIRVEAARIVGGFELSGFEVSDNDDLCLRVRL